MIFNELEKFRNDLFKNIYESNKSISEAVSYAPNQLLKSLQNNGFTNNIVNESSDKLTTFNYSEMVKYLGKNKHKIDDFCIGDHPDFKNVIGNHDSLNHYSVSCFIDIAGSTDMNNRLSLTNIRYIKDSILTLCIYVANFFGGHIHRLQGDGIFIQFVRKDRNHLDSIINSLNAASFILRTVNDLINPTFKVKGLGEIQLRAGIDYGSKDKVLWSHFGIPNCSELTTTSFHTDSAAKLQSKAKPDQIIIGDNICKELDLPSNLVEKKGDKILEYKYYLFKHLDYLNSFSFLYFPNATKNSIQLKKSEYTLQCNVKDESNSKYWENSYSIPKEKNIKFTLLHNGQKINIERFEFINWFVKNTGKEAKKANKIDIDLELINSDSCNVVASFLGHHKAICEFKAKDNHRKEVIEFPIFVQ
ncbi:MAG: hypothetical protein CVV25_04015 [Ignavibacteriae bacterium HGW-Ignavibacteriae-4]|jgi:class 3 adenylate cyclase|nr:MAG: hypothetical protein CVV25_04015 [Ignavibacteriae bacterium HGW-Ignavibacteriae-4]